MKKMYGSRSFIMDSGERFSLVINLETGLPLYYPSLFLTTQHRNKSDASSTIVSVASHLVIFHHFLELRKIDLEIRILKKKLFETHELDDLSDFCQKKFNAVTPNNAKVTKPATPPNSQSFVSKSTHYSRLTTIANYFTWLSSTISNEKEAIPLINTIKNGIISRRPRSKHRNQNLQIRSLTDVELGYLFEILRLESEFNPFSIEVRRRNRLIILMLKRLGIRRGELLNIRIKDIDFSANQLKIIRRADEVDDPRISEPNAKTLERILPLNDSLCMELHHYIVKERRRLANSKKHDFLFVTHKKGPTSGKPLSKPSYQKIMAVLKNISPELHEFTGHKLRHTWNEDFSEKMDSLNNPLSEVKQEQLRSYLMGWKPGSGTAATYNKRFIERQAFKAALLLQETDEKKSPRNINHEK